MVLKVLTCLKVAISSSIKRFNALFLNFSFRSNQLHASDHLHKILLNLCTVMIHMWNKAKDERKHLFSTNCQAPAGFCYTDSTVVSHYTLNVKCHSA